VPVLDRYLEALAKHHAEALVLRAGAPVELVIGGVNRAVTARPAGEDQINALLAEALGASFNAGLSGIRTYPYEGPSGPLSVQTDDSSGTLVVRIEPRAAAAASPPPARPAHVPSQPPPLGAPAPEVPPAVAAAPPPGPNAGVAAHRAAVPTGAGAPRHMDELFAVMLEMKASDLHLKAGKPPMVRVDGSMAAIPGRVAISPDDLFALLDAITPERNRVEFRETNDTDFAYEFGGRARMRCNVFRDLAGAGAVFRQIPSKILSAKDLRLPPAVIDFCGYDKGLVVVTGPTGSGKSTTLAAMIDWINDNRDDHIITIEDPVEFVHRDKKCLINQREVGAHTRGFKNALRAALREDPDIVLVGEMRDLETVAIAIETAETGHLVFGTLHTNTAPSTVDRLIDQFPADRQAQVRTMLAESLKGVVAQTLLKKKGGGRVAALEILVVTPAISNLIREGKTFQIPSLMQTGKGLGMQTLSDALMDLVKNDIVEPAEAFDRAPHKKEFAAILTRAGFRGPWSDDKTLS
jgi:twitching motility protein PilT